MSHCTYCLGTGLAQTTIGTIACPRCSGPSSCRGLPRASAPAAGRLWWLDQEQRLGIGTDTPQASMDIWVSGDAHILFHRDDGRVELRGFATPDAAARAFWAAVARLAPIGWRLEVPAEWGEGH